MWHLTLLNDLSLDIFIVLDLSSLVRRNRLYSNLWGPGAAPGFILYNTY